MTKTKKPTKLNLYTRHYVANLEASEYDQLDITEDSNDGRITFKLLEDRWRTKADTIALFKEVIDIIQNMDK